MARRRSLLIVPVLIHHCFAFMVPSRPNPGLPLRRFRFPEPTILSTLQATDEESTVPEMRLALVLRMRSGIEDGADEDGDDGELHPAIDVGAARRPSAVSTLRVRPAVCCADKTGLNLRGFEENGGHKTQ